MKGIFKLYFFKLIILSLTMIFISFGANAKGNTIGQLYKDCKIFQNNGFELTGLDQVGIFRSTICATRFNTMLFEGQYLCIALNVLYKKNIDQNALNSIAKMRANSGVKNIAQAVMTFINFAEKNPEKWDSDYQLYRDLYLGIKFPCNYKKL